MKILWVLIVVILGFAVVFWALTYLPDMLEKQKIEDTKVYARDCVRLGAYSVPIGLKEKSAQDAFQRKMIALAIDAGLTPEEADIWIMRDGILGALMTIPAVFEFRKIKDSEVENATTEFARQEAVGWMNIYRGGLGPNRRLL